MNGDQVVGVSFSLSDGDMVTVAARIVIDATDEGDVIALGHVEHVTGFESQEETGEPSAPTAAQPDNMQAATHVFAVEHRAGESHVIDKPNDYERWRGLFPKGWPGPLIGWCFPDPRTLVRVELPFSPNIDPSHDSFSGHAGDRPGDRDLWRYRRVLARAQLEPIGETDVTIVNWPQNDYFQAPLISASPTARAERLRDARNLSASLLYWLQTDAPRADGGVGWPGLRLRGDVLGTSDGFAMRPYTRESRRIRAEVTVVEQDIAKAVRGEKGARHYEDSVGIGYYRIDLHPSTGGDAYLDVDSWPFELPLGSLIPRRVDNLIAAGKNIGTTHITNGCYRVHPVEWTIGEAAGALAAFCSSKGIVPRAVRANSSHLQGLQSDLLQGGAELHWPDRLTQ
jgi:hypothetical protein